MPVLKLEQRQILLQVLERMFTKIEDLVRFISDRCGKNMDRIGTGKLDELRSAVVNDAETEEWTITLLEQLHVAAANRPEAKALLEKIGSIDDIREARFFDACWVDRIPLVDRGDFRQRLRQITTASNTRIIMVKGKRYTGNSHILHHLRHVTNTYGIPLCEINLRDYVGSADEVTPYDLGLAIAMTLELELPKSLDPKTSRWTVNFLNWLGPFVTTKYKRLWIAIDDFEPEKLKVKLPDPVYEFIYKLSERIGGGWPNLRMFLINYDGQELPNMVKPRVADESVPVEISDKDLRNFFLDFYNEHLPPTPIDVAAKDAAERANRVRQKMKGPPESLLEQMRDALIEQCDELLP